MFIHRHSDDAAQLDRAMAAVQASPDYVALGQDGQGHDRFTSREVIAVEECMHRATALMAERRPSKPGRAQTFSAQPRRVF